MFDSFAPPPCPLPQEARGNKGGFYERIIFEQHVVSSPVVRRPTRFERRFSTYSTFFLGALLGGLASGFVWGATPKEKSEKKENVPLPISDEELNPKPITRLERLPWVKKDPAGKPPPSVNPPPGNDDGLLPDLTGQPLHMKFSGPMTVHEERLPATKNTSATIRRTIRLEKDVLIRMPDKGLSVKAQSLRVVLLVRVNAAGKEEMEPQVVEALDDVEYAHGATHARCHSVLAEMLRDETGDVVKDVLTIRGDGRKKAILGNEAGMIQAQTFIIDRRLDTFHALGGAVLDYTLPAEPEDATTVAPVGLAGSGTAGLGGLSVKSGDRVQVRCDGEVAYEGGQKRVSFERNVSVNIGDNAIRLWTDTLTMTLSPADVPSKPAENQLQLFAAGAPRTIQCYGRVDLAAAEQLIFCDQAELDLLHKTAVLLTDNPKDNVELYLKQGEGVQRMTVQRRATFRFSAGGLTLQAGRRVIQPYDGEMPAPRRVRQTPERPGAVETK
jgi:hypothetical protein